MDWVSDFRYNQLSESSAPIIVMPTLAVTDTIRSLQQVEEQFGLSKAIDRTFFLEWQEGLPRLLPADEASCDRIKASYLHNSYNGSLTESTINLLLLSPLLYLSGFCDPPFKLRCEASVTIEVPDSEVIYRGRLDALILQDSVWLLLVESKQARLSYSMAIPQLLTYMMGSPPPTRPIYGMVTNGDTFLFVKLDIDRRLYAFSDDFSIFRQTQNELYGVLKILKQLQRQTLPIV